MLPKLAILGFEVWPRYPAALNAPMMDAVVEASHHAMTWPLPQRFIANTRSGPLPVSMNPSPSSLAPGASPIEHDCRVATLKSRPPHRQASPSHDGALHRP